MAATPPNAAPLKPLHGTPLVLLTIAVAFSTFMEVLDMTIVNVAVPHISGSLGVSASEGTWTISSYSLASAIMQPLTGWIARRFGEVRTFVVSVMLFVVFSMLCGMATSMPMLVIGRLLQGAGSGPMVALSLTLLSSYPKERQGIALALWAMTVVVAPIFGPILGGWITDNLSWPWIFYINLPVGVAAGVITWTLLHKRETKTVKAPIDAIGLLLLVAGVGCLQFMLDNGNDHDWFASPLILTLGITALICLTFLVVWELHAKHPVVDLSLFKQRNFTVGVISLSLFAHGRYVRFHRVRGQCVLVLHLRQLGLVQYVVTAALRDGYRHPLLLHSAQSDLSVRPACVGNRQCLGALQLLPHARLKRLHRRHGDAVATPWDLPPRHPHARGKPGSARRHGIRESTLALQPFPRTRTGADRSTGEPRSPHPGSERRVLSMRDPVRGIDSRAVVLAATIRQRWRRRGPLSLGDYGPLVIAC